MISLLTQNTRLKKGLREIYNKIDKIGLRG